MPRLHTTAPAKVNLTLAVLARRGDGYHSLSSLVVFAETGDDLSLDTNCAPGLTVGGSFAAAAGPADSNLVLRAAHELAERIEGLQLGHFSLTKNLPAGAGLGGGSSDAAAALRLIAQANDLPLNDARVVDAARATGADVPVCLEAKARLMHGVGDVLSPPLDLPALDAVLVFPGVALATKDVFGNFTLAAGPRRKARYQDADVPRERDALLNYLASEANDLELAARLAAPEVGEAKEMLERSGEPRLVRMSGSGSSVFGLYDSEKLAKRAAAKIKKLRPKWWVMQTVLR